MLLSQLLKDVKCKVSGNDIEITSIEYDSRKVTKGSLFVAVRGYQTDGHLYIDKAIENGASAILAEECDAKGNVTVAVTDDTRKAMAQAAAAFYGNSASRLKIIGVTGTNGKTTTTYLIKQILDLKGYKTGIIGTNQNMILDKVIESTRTTPESVELHKMFKEMEENGVTHVIMEVSSHSIALKRTYGITFETGVFTNLTRDHLDFHETMENYADSKAGLFECCKTGSYNADDKWKDRITAKAKCPMVSYGVNNKCDLKAEDIKLSERGVIFTLKLKGEEHIIRLGIPGEFSVYNALSAIAASLAIGISMEDIIKGLVLAKGVKGRAEVIFISTPYTVLIDYAHTPDGLENIIKAVKSFAKARIITVFGCGGDRDKTKRPLMGEIAAKMSDYCVVTSDNPRTEEPGAIIKDIVAGMKGYEDKYKVVEDRTEAIKYAMTIAEEQDIIILAGKGHETYQILKDKTIDYDERIVVRKIYKELAGENYA